MAEGRDAVIAHGIEIAVAGSIEEISALAPDKGNVPLGIERDQLFLFDVEDFGIGTRW